MEPKIDTGLAKQLTFNQFKLHLVDIFNLPADTHLADFEARLKKLSSFEKGVRLAWALDHDCWPGVREMAQDLCDWYTLDKLFNLVSLGRLPRELVEAFERSSSIRVTWSPALRIAASTYKIGAALAMAARIKQERAEGLDWPAKKVYFALTGKGEEYFHIEQ